MFFLQSNHRNRPFYRRYPAEDWTRNPFCSFFLTYNLFFIRACTRSFTGTAADATKPGSTPTAADPTITTASSTTQSRETS